MEHMIHLPEYQVVVCKRCQYAVLPSEIESHFKPVHPHRFTKEECQEIVERVARIEGLVQDRKELQQCEFPFPIDTSEAVAVLGVAKRGGFRCTFKTDKNECPYIAGSVRNIRRHCWEEHKWKSKNKGGRPRQSDIPRVSQEIPWRGGVQYQQFFKQGPRSVFFEVNRARTATEESNGPVQKSTWELFQEKTSQGYERVEDLEKRRIKATDESREPNPWLRRTGWARHLEGFDQVKMRDLVRPVEEDEPELKAIHQAFQELVRTAQRTAVTDVIGQPALFEAHRKEAGKKPNRPFNAHMDKTTFRQYTGVWNQLLSYIWRADDLDVEDRPGFKITSKQQTAFDRAIDIANSVAELEPEIPGSQVQKQQEERLQTAVLDWVIQLLDHPLSDQQYQSVVVSGLAVLGLQEGGRWANAEGYTPKLSAVIKLARLLVLQKAYNIRRQAINRRLDRGFSQEDAEREAPSHVQIVQQMNHKFMMLVSDKTEPSPMDWMLDTRTYGLYIRYHTPAEGSIGWKGDTILYQNIRFSMQQVQSMVHGLVSQARRILIEELLMLKLDKHGDVQGEQLPVIDWANIVDNPTEAKLGWSFLQDTRNQFESQIKGREWLARRIIETPELSRTYIQSRRPDGSIKWRRQSIHRYYRMIDQFQEQLLLLKHFAGGGPARAPEIISIRHRNSSNGGIRNVFIDNGMVLFVTAYHKGYEYSERTKLIQRFLPREVGELLVYYLWLALPFWETMQLTVDGAQQLSPFIWGNENSHTKMDRVVDTAEEADAEDPIISPARQGKPASPAELAPSSPVGSVISPARQVKLSRRPQFRAWTSERMRKIMQKESNARMGVGLNISAWRQVAIAIARRFIREEYRFDTREEESDQCDNFDEDNHQGDSAWDLQSGHGTRMAGMIYGRLLFEAGYETQTQKEQYRKVSQEWHRFLGFQSAIQGLDRGFGSRIGQKRKKSHWEQVNQEMQQFRQRQLRYANIQARLEEMMGVGSQFRGQQKPAIEAIVQGHSPVVVIMGTGGGKSLIFMLPASCVSGGTTIVIVPLVALQGDLQERCEKANISSMVWSSQRPYESASIVFVIPESAVSKTFAGFVNRLQEMHQLDRIVVDECHTILDGSPQFRPKLRQLGELGLIGVQMVYLTATLPPRDEDEFYRIMHIPRQHVQLFRGRTTRKNIRYQVQEIEVPERDNVFGWKEDRAGFEPAIQDAVVQVVQQKLKQYPAPAKIIIYSSIIKGAEGLAEALECQAYHRNVDSTKGKARRLDNWRSAVDDRRLSQGRVVVATNALGLGVDIPDIRVVIHVGKIYTLKDYAQESGRGGRDGQPSEAIIIRGVGAGGEDYSHQTDIPVAVAMTVDIQEFISGNICRRVVLDQVMDARRVRDGCEEGEEVCDVCIKKIQPGRFPDSGFGSSQRQASNTDEITSSDIPSSPAVLRQVRQQRWMQQEVVKKRRQEGSQVKELVEYLEEWVGGCPLCQWQGGPNPWHDISKCQRDEAGKILEQVHDIRKRVKFERFSCCYNCGIPQGICNRWQQKEETGWWEEVGEGRCQYPRLVIEVVCTLFTEGKEEEVEEVYHWMRGLGVDIYSKESVHGWYKKRVEWGGLEASGLVQVFYQLAKRHRL